jgi:hypothetical protein
LERAILQQDKETTVDSTDTPPVPADETKDAPAVPLVDTAVPTHSSGLIRLLATAVIIAGIIMIVAGAFTWFVVQDQLEDENITVSDDAERFVGDPVDGPLTAYAEANVIEKHALEASGGLTYAEIDREDPVRQTVMDASFLRASLFTSVVAFGVALMAAGLGVVLILVGVALLKIARQLTATPVAVAT